VGGIMGASPTRRVTAIYYANPVDWDAERDGGCLQVRLTSRRLELSAQFLTPSAGYRVRPLKKSAWMKIRTQSARLIGQ
jgi:hypothetical protein